MCVDSTEKLQKQTMKLCKCMQSPLSTMKADAFMVGPRLRSFFVLLCNMGAPAALLWGIFKDTLCEDLLERNPNDPELAYKLSLLEIDRSGRKLVSYLTDQGLPYVEDDTSELGRELLTYGENQQSIIVEEWLHRLSPDQRAVFNHVQYLLDNTGDFQTSRVIFLDGPGGYGKTQLIRVLLALVRSRQYVASSGIALARRINCAQHVCNSYRSWKWHGDLECFKQFSAWFSYQSCTVDCIWRGPHGSPVHF